MMRNHVSHLQLRGRLKNIKGLLGGGVTYSSFKVRQAFEACRNASDLINKPIARGNVLGHVNGPGALRLQTRTLGQGHLAEFADLGLFLLLGRQRLRSLLGLLLGSLFLGGSLLGGSLLGGSLLGGSLRCSLGSSWEPDVS